MENKKTFKKLKMLIKAFFIKKVKNIKNIFNIHKTKCWTAYDIFRDCGQ